MAASTKSKSRRDLDDEEDEVPAKKKRAVIEDDEEDEAPKPKKKRPVVDEDDEDEAPRPKKKRPVEDDEEDEAPVKKSKKRPVDEDEDEEEVKPRKKKAVVEDDEEEEDVKPKKKKRPVDDDDDKPAAKRGGWGTAGGSGGFKKEELWDSKLNRFEVKQHPDEFVEIRLVGNPFPVLTHWVPVKPEDAIRTKEKTVGPKEKISQYPFTCPDFDHVNEVSTATTCPHCMDFDGYNRKDLLYYANAFVKIPGKRGAPAEWSDDLYVITLKLGVLIALREIIKLKGGKDPADVKEGFSINLKFNPKAKKATEFWNCQFGEFMPLTKSQRATVKEQFIDFDVAFKPSDVESELQSLKRRKFHEILEGDVDERVEKVGSKKKRPVIEDDDEDEAPKPKKKRPVEDEDEDEEPPRKSAKRKPVDEDEDEDEAPKPKKKKPAFSDDDEEDELPKKSKKRPVEDEDEDEEEPVKKPKKKPAFDEDEEDDLPKKSKKKPAFSDDDEDEDEPPRKSAKRKPVDEDEDEDEAPKPKKKRPVDEDEEDDDEDVLPAKSSARKRK